MTYRLFLTLAGALLLAGCGAQQEGAGTTSEQEFFDVAEAPAPGSGTARPTAAVLPQIAYTYGYRFRLASDAVSGIQEKHLDLCEKLGPARCRVVDLQRSASSGDYVSGSLKLAVAAPIARQFGQQLVSTATEAGGETLDRGITGEDLSKQIVDTDARIRIKEALVERLTVILQTRSGNIAQAVEAERAVNAAQEELEQARAWLAEMRTRVAMSMFEIDYESGAPLGGGFSEPVRDAFASVGQLFGRSLAFIILLVAFILPWLLVAAAAFLGFRAARRRGWIGGRFRPPHPQAESEPAASELPS